MTTSATEPPRLTACSASLLQFALESAGVAVHPDDHGCRKHHGNDTDDPFPIISCCACGRLVDSKFRPTPTPMQMSTAKATPANIATSRLAVTLEERTRRCSR